MDSQQPYNPGLPYGANGPPQSKFNNMPPPPMNGSMQGMNQNMTPPPGPPTSQFSGMNISNAQPPYQMGPHAQMPPQVSAANDRTYPSQFQGSYPPQQYQKDGGLGYQQHGYTATAPTSQGGQYGYPPSGPFTSNSSPMPPNSGQGQISHQSGSLQQPGSMSSYSNSMPPSGPMTYSSLMQPPGPMTSHSGPMQPPGPMTSHSGPMQPPGPMTSHSGQMPPSGPMSSHSGPMQPPGPMTSQSGPLQPPNLMPPYGGAMSPSGPVPSHSGSMHPPGPMTSYSGAMPPPGSQSSPMIPGGMPPHTGPMPPQPQTMNRGPGYPQQPHPPSQQHQINRAPGPSPPAQRRLSADQMPSAIQVIEDDRANRSGIFTTGTKGQAPPLVTTDFVAQDQGNCNPRFIRSTMYNIPTTADLLKQTGIPFALTITPFAKLHEQEQPVPIGGVETQGPVRCIRCKAYMNPFMTFIDGGRRFQCTLCGGTTEVPGDYFAHLDHTGRRVDAYQRPELCMGSYELIATKEYCRNDQFPQAPAIIFMIDVSYNSVKRGLLEVISTRIKEEVLTMLPKEEYSPDAESEVRVGFVTYDKALHFYNVKSCLSQPQMQIVSDVEDVFVPLVDGFLVKVSEAELLLDTLFDMIGQEYANTQQVETVLGPVIEAGRQALEAAGRPGKLIVFHSTLPTAEAPGKLKNRDDKKLLGTEKEKTLLTPSSTYYTNLGQACVTVGCSVDLFLFTNTYFDVASMSEVSKISGGSIYRYPYFTSVEHGDLLISDLVQAVSGTRAYDAVMRVRTSAGTRPVDFHGNFFMSNTTDVELAALDAHKSITVDIRHDDKLAENDTVFIQAAVLYTSVSGQRRLRVHNLSLLTTSQMTDVFRVAELDTTMNVLCKLSIATLLAKSAREVREDVASRCSSILAAYRKHCTQAGNPGELILPEVMKLMPLYCNCLTKCDALQGGSDISTDDRSYQLFLMNNFDVHESAVYLYPKLLPLHNLDTNSKKIPIALRCSVDRLQPEGAYLLENGIFMYIWIGKNIPTSWLHSVFGVQSINQLDCEKAILHSLDNTTSQRVREVIEHVRAERSQFVKLKIVVQGDSSEYWFKRLMVEDRGDSGTPSYVDYLCHIHKEIRNLLN